MGQSSLAKLAELAYPAVMPPLDNRFRPAVLANRAFHAAVAESGDDVPLAIGLERGGGLRSVYQTRVLPESHPQAQLNLPYAERLVKFLLWQKGGWKVAVGGPRAIGEHIQRVYSTTGERAFDADTMGPTLFEHPFTVEIVAAADVPPASESPVAIGRHTDGCRIGFDLGASDRKVAAVIDGEPVFTEEVVWDPRNQPDPQYHYDEIMAGLKSAAAHLPRVDAIGGSSAGAIINNRVMAASLFRAVPRDIFNARVKDIFLSIGRAWGVPLEVANDGDVTALAGAMWLNEDSVLGIAMGSSEAAGYVDGSGRITGWLNELAFAPIDYHPEAPVDEWSGDRGCGVQYLTQQAVFRLAASVGIALDESQPLADRLKAVQALLEQGDEQAQRIWQTIGCYMGYAVAHYADFYDVRHMLVLGRVTSGSGGHIILEQARAVLAAQFPELVERVQLHLPDESSRRVGQAAAAASLPLLEK